VLVLVLVRVLDQADDEYEYENAYDRQMGDRSTRRAAKQTDRAARLGTLRIIGGSLRGRRIEYSGDPRTRPMKDRVREAIFNLLGPGITGKHAIDLFAGTGALGFEAISRGAARATLIDRHFPTADLIRKNAASLGIAGRCEVVAADTFFWATQRMPSFMGPVAAFVSPPYGFYVERLEEMLSLIQAVLARAEAGGVLVVEADERFDFGRLPHAERWDIRAYSPAVVGILDAPQ
jgi:16S rRNA (guanine966-N2)-methyltransferase